MRVSFTIDVSHFWMFRVFCPMYYPILSAYTTSCSSALQTNGREISIREAKHSVPISFDFRPVLAVMLRVSPDLSNLLYWGCKNQGWYLGYWQYEGEEDDLEDEWLELGGTTLRIVVMVLLLQQVGCFIQNIPSPRVTCQTYLVGRWKPK